MSERPVRRHTVPGQKRGIHPSPERATVVVRPAAGTRRVQALALAALSAAALVVGAQAALADAFLSSRMTVSAPAGASNLCTLYPWACQQSSAAIRISGGQLDIAIRINRQLNRQVRSISDQSQYGRVEHWSLPTARGGDCEDFALIKKKRLIEAGLDPQMLLVSTVLDRNRNAHAVLVMRTAQGDFILDNLRDEVLHWRQTGYTFLRMQDPANPARWTAVIDGGILRNDNAVSTPRMGTSGATAAAPSVAFNTTHSR